MGNLLKLLLIFNFNQFIFGKLHGYGIRNPLDKNKNPRGSPWPFPKTWIKSSLIASISKFEFESNLEISCDPLDFIMRKFEDYEFNFSPIETPDTNYPRITKVNIFILPSANGEIGDIGCNSFPKYSEDSSYEEYHLKIDSRNQNEASVSISAYTVWGAIKGIDTFSQLIWSNLNPQDYHYYVNFTEISDFPRFPHRGVMLDTSRHYLSMDIIETILDSLLYNKFNVLHLHLVDDQSFPFVSRRFPELSAMGAYKNGTLVYTPEMIQKIQNDARLRGIRVILEFDTPGHTGGFGLSHPELLTPCYGTPGIPETPNHPHHAARENFDPTKEYTYTFMREFFTEIVNDVSKDLYVHLGMDEVYTPCWDSSPEIAKFMEENNYVNMSQVQAHYTQRHVEMVKSLGAIPISWQDPLDAGVNLDKDILIHAWKDIEEGKPWQEYVKMILGGGYKMILSSCWYINYIAYGEQWKKYYECDPIIGLDVPEEQKKLVKGGEAAIWGEFVDKTNIIPRLFPYSSATAERLWSFEFQEINQAMHRLDEHRCRLLRRGIAAQPLLNGYCEEHGIF